MIFNLKLTDIYFNTLDYASKTFTIKDIVPFINNNLP